MPGMDARYRKERRDKVKKDKGEKEDCLELEGWKVEQSEELQRQSFVLKLQY